LTSGLSAQQSQIILLYVLVQLPLLLLLLHGNKS
jgi:hypothetical protein